MSTDDQAQTTLLAEVEAAGLPYFTTCMHTYYDLLSDISGAQTRVSARDRHITSTLRGGRNVDAVDDLARCRFYDEELENAWDWCVEMIDLTNSVLVMMDGIVFVDNEVRDEHLEVLDDLPAMMEVWQDWLMGKARVLAIISLSRAV